MRDTDRGKRILSLLCYVLLSIVFHIAPVDAEELTPRQAPARNIKGFWEVNLYTQTAARTLVEETSGVNFEGMLNPQGSWPGCNKAVAPVSSIFRPVWQTLRLTSLMTTGVTWVCYGGGAS